MGEKDRKLREGGLSPPMQSKSKEKDGSNQRGAKTQRGGKLGYAAEITKRKTQIGQRKGGGNEQYGIVRKLGSPARYT